MKDENKYQEKFLEVLKERISNHTVLANTLLDILTIDKDSVYRRLRGEIPFSFREVLAIAQETGISLDNIIGTACGHSLIFKLPMVDYIHLTDADYQTLENYLKILKLSYGNNYSEVAEFSNNLPLGLYLSYPCLTKFYMCKWWYRNSSFPDIKPYHKINIPEKLKGIFREYQACSKYISTTYYLWDCSIFRYIITDIRFFSEMKLITKEEVLLIKDELIRLLEYVHGLCETGQYKETGNKIIFYITDSNHGITCSYLDLIDQKLSVFKTFTLNVLMSAEREVFDKVKNLISSMKRMSTSITESNEKQRIAFISAQRKILEKF